MAWTPYQCFLCALMLTTGSINTLTAGWADHLKSINRNGEMAKFDHPFVQASFMFLGEMLCFVAFKILYCWYKRTNEQDNRQLTRGNRNFSPFLLFIPAMCDLYATSTSYVGLNITYPSSYQMFRGSVIIFVGILSTAFLHRQLVRRQWNGIVLISVGLTIVGFADFMYTKPSDDAPDSNSIITGDLLIVMAQIVCAIQMVTEEKFVDGLDIPPLEAVGYEGIFGFCVLALLHIPMNYIKVGAPFGNNASGAMEDVLDAFVQMSNNWRIIIATAGTSISIAFFNFAGISVTKEISATTRMVMDALRIVVVWAFSLAFLDQPFIWQQLPGFFILLAGMCWYEGLTPKVAFIWTRQFIVARMRTPEDEEAVINDPAHDPDSETI